MILSISSTGRVETEVLEFVRDRIAGLTGIESVNVLDRLRGEE